MKVNFSKFKIFLDIAHAHAEEQDIRKDFADVIYRNARGIMAHDLALRIYRSEDEVEISDEEASLIMELVNQSTPNFIDSMKYNLYGEAD